MCPAGPKAYIPYHIIHNYTLCHVLVSQWVTDGQGSPGAGMKTHPIFGPFFEKRENVIKSLYWPKTAKNSKTDQKKRAKMGRYALASIDPGTRAHCCVLRGVRDPGKRAHGRNGGADLLVRDRDV